LKTSTRETKLRMLNIKTIFTISVRFLILLLNFGIVILTARLWGNDGRGEIALFLTNLSLILVGTNIVCGSSLAYYSNTIDISKQIMPIALFSAIISGIGAITCMIFTSSIKEAVFLLFSSILMSGVSALAVHYLGSNRIVHYNLVSLLPPSLNILIILIFQAVAPKFGTLTYYIATITSNVLVLTAFLLQKRKNLFFTLSKIYLLETKKILQYGFANETNNFIQFLNYRFSYYIIVLFLGKDQLGLYSISVAIVESIWIISKSISSVQFAEIINMKNKEESRILVTQNLRNTVVLTVFAIFIMAILPESIFTYIFGKSFVGIQTYSIYLAPGILATAIANIYGHYFTALGNLKTVIIKSLAGLAASIVLSLGLIPQWGLAGACIATNASYMISASYLFLIYRKDSTQNSLQQK
jgi:O-antigen/teichoic acid export membrane protein